MLHLNEALALDFGSNVTSLDQLECFISAYNSQYNLVAILLKNLY